MQCDLHLCGAALSPHCDEVNHGEWQGQVLKASLNATITYPISLEATLSHQTYKYMTFNLLYQLK